MIKLSKLFDGAIREHDDEADAVLTVILKQDGDSQLIIAGVDELMIGTKAVELARILSDILQTKLNKAYRIAEIEGNPVHFRETQRPISEVSDDGDDENGDDENGDDEEPLCEDIKFVLEKLAHGLLELISK